ncbi:MerR family transcriptional regulator [Bdellovibrio sp. NC01]|uniref:MerR family transcriptional regulator n=1 Tax=Bdellovibrio sp. NC01 TaxID=2220073 RepID=UPI00115AB738|nr:MerR family transcriptional regulator [Bdellovibrio sp. NC01]QDK37548.1 heavy metal-responsive transcriptional regulator [Bdellovibrio sp. NC01]
MKIGDLAKKVGLSVSRVRYYETLGIIRAKRGESNYRDFPPESERLLLLVLQAKDLGFTLKEIQTLASALQQGALTKNRVRSELTKKLDALDERIAIIKKFQKNVRQILESACPFDVE